MMASARMRRVQRSANTFAGGQDLLDHLLKEQTRSQLIKAAEDGVPPVSRVSASLSKLALVKGIDIKTMSVRQFVGIAVRAILEDEGYTIVEKGIRLPRDPIFMSGSVYAKYTETEQSQGVLLERLLRSFSDVEAEQALSILKNRLQSS